MTYFLQLPKPPKSYHPVFKCLSLWGPSLIQTVAFFSLPRLLFQLYHSAKCMYFNFTSTHSLSRTEHCFKLSSETQGNFFIVTAYIIKRQITYFQHTMAGIKHTLSFQKGEMTASRRRNTEPKQDRSPAGLTPNTIATSGTSLLKGLGDPLLQPRAHGEHLCFGLLHPTCAAFLGI